ncbi:hypothetical protein [Winogradskyella sp. 3972H.M.0a.05]|uniref:hypothetical protein n=1 Tax=Winogradskyella sp. 3972H.M.0a.05 TaxID=2950277 RepID=UPI00339A351A
MTFKKSPIPYLALLVIVLGLSISSHNIMDEKINSPIVVTVDVQQSSSEVVVSIDEKNSSVIAYTKND